MNDAAALPTPQSADFCASHDDDEVFIDRTVDQLVLTIDSVRAERAEMAEERRAWRYWVGVGVVSGYILGVATAVALFVATS